MIATGHVNSLSPEEVTALRLAFNSKYKGGLASRAVRLY